MENKTAVMWLIDTYFGGTDNITANFKKHIEQAIELEKQQIIQTYKIAQVNVMINATVRSEQYYSETYKKPTE